MKRIQFNNSYDIEKILEIILAFNGVSDRTVLLSIILTNMMEITGSDAGTVYTIENGKLHFRILQNKTLGIFQSSEKEEISLPPISLDERNIKNISAYCAINNEAVIIDDVYTRNTLFNFDGPKKYDELTGYRTKAMVVLPICTQRDEENEVLGVIQMMNPIHPQTGEIDSYGDINDSTILPALTKVAANTLSNLTQVKEMQLFLRSFAIAMTQAIDERSHYNSSHTKNVAMYCERFAKYLSNRFPKGHHFYFDKLHAESLTLAALLHDVGKVITPLDIMDKANRLGNRLESVRYRFDLKKAQLEIEYLKNQITPTEYEQTLNELDVAMEFVEQVNTISFLDGKYFPDILALKNMTFKNRAGYTERLLSPEEIEALSVIKGTLTAGERRIMEEHVEITNRILAEIPFWKYYADVPEWAGCHHEFLDGTGYPKGLVGDEIPMEACIISIMDIFDALIATDRPYKKGVPVEKALEILQDMVKEGKLHKELVALFSESKIWEE